MQIDGRKTPLGYFMRNSHKIIPIKSSMLLEEPINKAFYDLADTIQKISASQKIKKLRSFI
jgi:hypothetical protein